MHPGLPARSRAPLRTTRLSVGTLFLVVVVLTSAGPFGVEEMVSATGPGLALLLLPVIPLVWWPSSLDPPASALVLLGARGLAAAQPFHRRST